jgi:hypothetical protein
VTNPEPTTPPSRPFEPRFPTLVATGLFSLWILVLSLPAWSGRFLAGPFSDQYDTGYAFRDWLAAEVKRTGSIPLWNPELFGGLPFVGAMHGDIFYPTAWLRLILPTGTAMTIGFVVHYVLAGLFTYLLLRRLRVTWAGAVTGGLAYQLSGVIGTYVQPGHDGKLFVTTLLPLVLLGLVRGIRERRADGFGIVALGVGLALLSPHAQMTYYLLIAAGLFALYLTFGEPDDAPLARRLAGLGWSLGAVVLGFGIGMVQLLPFFAYLPYSPRAEGYYGFEGSVSYAIPWAHVPEFFLAGFTGATPSGTYWGPNPLKLHSEYLGLPVIALAVTGALAPGRRRLAVWAGGIGMLFFLITLGGGTPFYRLWWTVMPFVKQTRAPGMALYVVALVLAIFAALGVDRLTAATGPAHRRGLIWGVIGAAVLLLSLAGIPGAMAESGAQGIQLAQGRPTVAAAQAAQGAIRVGGLLSGLALLALGLLVAAHDRARMPVAALAFGVPLVVGADLWRNAAPFWSWSPPPRAALYGGDAFTARLDSVPLPYRVLNVPGAYPGSSLMAYRIPQLLGYHGNELHAFDQLMGGKNAWRNLGNPRIWGLYAVRFLLVASGEGVPEAVPGYRRWAAPIDRAGGGGVVVFEREEAPAYAWVSAGAVKADDSTAAAAVLDPRLDPRSVTVLAEDAPIAPAPLAALPEPLGVAASVREWEPGRMTIDLTPAPQADAYLVVAENWYQDWTATVDGRSTPVVRANLAQIGVPVAAGSREVALRFHSPDYERGRLLSLLSAAVVFGVLLAPRLRRGRHA